MTRVCPALWNAVVRRVVQGERDVVPARLQAIHHEDHGTALDLAGHGHADMSSLNVAIETALQMISAQV
mgnify:CR=1 FL=1